MHSLKTTQQPILQNFHIEGVRHITPTDAFEAITTGEAVMIDVREMNEVQLESIPLERVLNHPMSVIIERLPYIAKDQQIIVGCSGGMRSVKVARFLSMEGYSHVASLDGGFNVWKAKGLPFGSNPQTGGCGCYPVIQKDTVIPSPLAPVKNSLTGIDLKT